MFGTNSKMKVFAAFAVALVLAVAPSVSGQDADAIDFDTYRQSFGNFAEGIANSLGMNTTIGLNTSDAYIGQLFRFPPNIGAGATIGASTIPIGPVTSLFSDLGIEEPAGLADFETIGMPFPAAAGDLRVGGIIFPFDAGIKFGTVPPELAAELGPDIDLDYTLAGFDVRVPIVKERLLVPSVSIGAGYNYLDSSVLLRDVTEIPFQIDLSDVYPDYSDYRSIGMSDPDASLSWNSNVIDMKAQASMNLWLLTPYVGAGASFARSNVGGGLVAELVADRDGDGELDINQPLTEEEVEDLKQQLRDYNEFGGGDIDEEVIENLSPSQGITVHRGVNGWSFRIFGGTSVNLLIFRLDMGVGYDLLGENFSGTVGLRVQL